MWTERLGVVTKGNVFMKCLGQILPGNEHIRRIGRQDLYECDKNGHVKISIGARLA
jgi:hypothetical protein